MDQTVSLNTGATMPVIGYGTWKLADGDEAYNATLEAIRAGYRLIDTAKIYGNEQSVGRAIADSGVKRGDLFVTTKLWKSDMGYESALRAFDESLRQLGLDYLDLYLVHWPENDLELRKDSWRALTELQEQGKAKAIGVSNYGVDHLKEMEEYTDVLPAVNQVEFNPPKYQDHEAVLQHCLEAGIVIEAYSPLARAHVLDDPKLIEIAKSHNKTPAQVSIRWCLQHQSVPIPKSSNPERIRENQDVFDFELTGEEMGTLNSLSL